MKTNLLLTVLGASMLLTVFFRTNKISQTFLVNTIPILISLLLLCYFNFRTAGRVGVTKGFMTGYAVSINFMPVLIMSFLAMGQGMILLSQYRQELQTFLSGQHGLPGTLVAAAVTPGSITGLPIVKEMWLAGINKECLLLFLVTSPLIGWQMFFFKLPMLGWRITIIQSVASLAVACITLICLKFGSTVWYAFQK